VRRKRAIPSSSKASSTGGEGGQEGKEEGEVPPLLWRKRTIAKPMSLEEALSQLTLSKEDFLVFINSDSGQMNVVYRSKKGGYGWVEPHPK
jgi:putative sigma-54 modulation protein